MVPAPGAGHDGKQHLYTGGLKGKQLCTPYSHSQVSMQVDLYGTEEDHAICTLQHKAENCNSLRDAGMQQS